MNLSPRAREQLAVQHQKYFDSLPAKRERIVACWHAIQSDGWGSEQLRDLKTEVHRLSGSAGSYGLPDLGLAARNLDKVLSADLNPSIITTSIAELTDELLHTLDQAILRRSPVPAAR
jgi:HPt (histidine-containing phosphotransfer) domain-containing protein